MSLIKIATGQLASPALVIEYTDPLENFQGWLVRDSLCYSMCAGGMRVQPGLSREHLILMARNMTRKMQMAGLRVDGAKCGIDYDPATSGKPAAIARFLHAIKPFIETNYSMGPDLNVEMSELEGAAATIGILSVKMAVALAQGWTLDYYLDRAKVLAKQVNGWSLGQLRAGYGVSAAALAVLDYLKIRQSTASIALQGFGTLAKATAFGLVEAGVKIVGVADAEKCFIASGSDGIDLTNLLSAPGVLLPCRPAESSFELHKREEITGIECDILIPAAVEKTITEETARRLKVKAVVPGANLAVTSAAEQILHDRGIIVLPDFLAGCGGSLSMEGLFGPVEHPAPTEVLGHVKERMTELTFEVLDTSCKLQITPTEAALRICAGRPCYPGSRPYGALNMAGPEPPGSFALQGATTHQKG